MILLKMIYLSHLLLGNLASSQPCTSPEDWEMEASGRLENIKIGEKDLLVSDAFIRDLNRAKYQIGQTVMDRKMTSEEILGKMMTLPPFNEGAKGIVRLKNFSIFANQSTVAQVIGVVRARLNRYPGYENINILTRSQKTSYVVNTSPTNALPDPRHPNTFYCHILLKPNRDQAKYIEFYDPAGDLKVEVNNIRISFKLSSTSTIDSAPIGNNGQILFTMTEENKPRYSLDIHALH